jgi:hypothetical protein
MNFRAYLTLRLGGEDTVRKLVAERALGEKLEPLMDELGIEIAHVLLLMPESHKAFEAFISRLISAYHEGQTGFDLAKTLNDKARQ